MEDRGARGAVGGIRIVEGAAERGMRAEHRQQVRRDADRPDPFRLAVAGEIEIGADRNRDLLEARCGAADVEVLRRRKPVLFDPEAR